MSYGECLFVLCRKQQSNEFTTTNPTKTMQVIALEHVEFKNGIIYFKETKICKSLEIG